jgi:hypothetical protein
LKIITVALMRLVVAELAYSDEPKKSEAASLQRHDEIISQLCTAYAAFNRGDFDAAVAVLVPKIEWTLLISASQSATIPRGEVSPDNRGRAEHEYDCKS